jgi:hypothetical protein
VYHCFGGLFALLRLARHGTADDDDGHGDDVTRLRVFDGVCWSAFADVRLGAARAGRAFVLRTCCLVGGCLGVGPVARSLVLAASASVASALLRPGCAREGGWVGRWAGRWQCNV